jgi:hypothetical protein
MYGFMFGDRTDEFRRQLDETGCAFLPYYANEPGYGITLFDPAALESAMSGIAPGLRLLRYSPRGWDDHQDLFSFQRRD